MGNAGLKKIIAMHTAQTPDGNAVTIYEIEEFSDSGTLGDLEGQGSGIKRWELADGRILTMVGLGEFKIKGTDDVFLVKDQQ